MTGIVMTDEKLATVISMREQGKTVGMIAVRVGINPKTVDYHLRKLGVFPEGWQHRGDTRTKRSWTDKNGRSVKAFTPADDARITRLAAEGKTNTQIGKIVGRKPNSVGARLTALANREACSE